MTASALADAALEYPNCPLCGSAKRRTKFAALNDLQHGTPGLFGVVTCDSCGADYLYPRPDADGRERAYPDAYQPWSAQIADRDPGPWSYRIVKVVAEAMYRARFGQIGLELEPFGNGRLLDVGCGSGMYLESMQRLGWDVYGVEVGPLAATRAVERVGHRRVHLGTVEQLPPGWTGFDLINVSHVLEHLVDPRSVLGEIRSRLSHTGRLWIVVPDSAGLEAQVFSRYWLGLDVPRHLVMFSRKQLRALLEEQGFALIRERPQFAPEMPRWSLHHWVDRGVPPPLRWLARPLIRPALAISMLSYPFGYVGAIDVLAEIARPGS